MFFAYNPPFSVAIPIVLETGSSCCTSQSCAHMYKTDRAKYEATARSWPHKYAMVRVGTGVGGVAASSLV
ncbi:hypothetical protein AAHE18_17G100900 [Arachis hypogaea]